MRARGFTLIEVLVAIALLSLLSLGIFSTLRVAQAVTIRTQSLETTVQDQLVAHRFLRQAIGSAYPILVEDLAPGEGGGLKGDDQELRVISSIGVGLGSRGLQRLRIRLEKKEGGVGDLVVYASVNGVEEASEFAVTREVLLDGVQAVEWSYLGDNDSGDWVSHWADAALPRLVRLRLTYADSRIREWPELIVATRLTNDGNCEFDIVAQGCRGQVHRWLP